MESIIRDGHLRLLTAESSCDVILSCQGHRLMAHKLILSMASPVFRGLLVEACSDPTVVILPDINGSIMSLVLDYIYTGSVVVYSNIIQEFLGVASLLKIHLDVGGFSSNQNKLFHKNVNTSKCDFDEYLVKKNEEGDYREKVESVDVVSPSNPEVYSRKNQRKLPSLVPIGRVQSREKLKSRRKLYSYVLPSPWCPRVERIFGDPRDDCLELRENKVRQFKLKCPRKFVKLACLWITEVIHVLVRCAQLKELLLLPKNLRPTNTEENDSNNNFKHHPGLHSPFNYTVPNKPNDTIPNVYQTVPSKTPKVQNTPTPSAFSFESHILKKLKTPPPHTKAVPKKGENPAGYQTGSLHVTKSGTIGDVLASREGSVTDSNDSVKDSSRDSDSNHSSGVEDDRTRTQAEKQKPFKCEECGKCFSQMRNYKYHRSVHEGTKEFAAKCPECGKVFNDRGYLSSHLKIHRDKKEYACPHCPKRFNQRVAYNMHLRIHTGVKPYSCNLCPKSFTKKHHLKTHMNSHTGVKPYTCAKCGLAFSQSSNMRTHYKKCILRSSSDAAADAQKDSS
ncbi:hypothetical protein NQ318_019608 [Aromia moschata]|uniref:Uncharacterized protein n=1 Tax=Aromia moschata TaxID=1265417 RepID=A0AAV8Z3Y8_9CUCU|nr:hypothetical protein NQ318_019608 [Aromia moschata]